MTRQVMLSLCDRTGAMCLPWAEAGYDCYAVDIQHPRGVTQHPLHEDITAIGASVYELFTDVVDLGALDVAFVAAFPPCTDLAVSGARWFREKGLRRRGEAIALVGRCLEIAEDVGAPYCIENPIGILSSHWRKPDHTFHPYEFGGYEGGEDDGYTKRTCLWVGNGFVMPEPRPIDLADDHDRIHKAPPSEERGDIRSITPAGFARAVFEANHEAPVDLMAALEKSLRGCLQTHDPA